MGRFGLLLSITLPAALYSIPSPLLPLEKTKTTKTLSFTNKSNHSFVLCEGRFLQNESTPTVIIKYKLETKQGAKIYSAQLPFNPFSHTHFD